MLYAHHGVENKNLRVLRVLKQYGVDVCNISHKVMLDLLQINTCDNFFYLCCVNRSVLSAELQGCPPKPQSLSFQEYEKLIDLISHSSLKLIFEKQPVAKFWCTLKRSLRTLGD
jgi:hypothetical protein